MTPNQKTIVEFAKANNNRITKKQACELIPYYRNTAKHVSDVLSRMVKADFLKRIKNGVFELSTGQIEFKNQLELF